MSAKAKKRRTSAKPAAKAKKAVKGTPRKKVAKKKAKSAKATPKKKKADKPTPESPSPKPADKPADKPAPAIDGPSERPVDVVVMGYRGKALGAKKKKDVTKGKPFKVNVYQDAGKSTVNRAKIDLDRDDKFDEKWTFDGDTISRKVSPNDDESYTEEYVWDGKAWAKR